MTMYYVLCTYITNTQYSHSTDAMVSMTKHLFYATLLHISRKSNLVPILETLTKGKYNIKLIELSQLFYVYSLKLLREYLEFRVHFKIQVSLLKQASLHSHNGARPYSCPYYHSANLKSSVEFTFLCNQQMPPSQKKCFQNHKRNSVAITLLQLKEGFELLPFHRVRKIRNLKL